MYKINIRYSRNNWICLLGQMKHNFHIKIHIIFVEGGLEQVTKNIAQNNSQSNISELNIEPLYIKKKH